MEPEGHQVMCVLPGWVVLMVVFASSEAAPSIASPYPPGDFLWIQSHINLTNAYPMCVGCPKRNQIQLLTLGNSQSLWLKKTLGHVSRGYEMKVLRRL